MNKTDGERTVTKSITVAVNIERAFQVWTEQLHAWWPTSHSLSGDPHTQVFIESRVGGRFYERTTEGVEHQWGLVEVWEPPTYLTFSWYLGSGPKIPSKVEVSFLALDTKTTRVDLIHRGPELIGKLWWQRKHIFHASWDTILARYGAFLAD
ncbi:MAG: SRPBCC domain-containing protein [Anaerolineae bacterium]|nr:SRPBCC domain-containing protein [Anaerolineae bacterium]